MAPSLCQVSVANVSSSRSKSNEYNIACTNATFVDIPYVLIVRMPLLLDVEKRKLYKLLLRVKLFKKAFKQFNEQTNQFIFPIYLS